MEAHTEQDVLSQKDSAGQPCGVTGAELVPQLVLQLDAGFGMQPPEESSVCVLCLAPAACPPSKVCILFLAPG